MKERGTDIESLATSAQTKPVKRPASNKKSSLAQPSGTARLTEANLKKMERAHAKEDKEGAQK